MVRMEASWLLRHMASVIFVYDETEPLGFKGFCI